VIHERHYSLEEAAELLPDLVELIARMRQARDRLGDREAREALSEASPTNGGGAPGRTVSEGFLELRDSMTKLRDLDVVLRDLRRLGDLARRLPDGQERRGAGRHQRHRGGEQEQPGAETTQPQAGSANL